MMLARAVSRARRGGARVAPALGRRFSSVQNASAAFKDKLVIFGGRRARGRAPRACGRAPSRAAPRPAPRPRADTTLRDGEQSPGATLTGKEKLLIARMLWCARSRRRPATCAALPAARTSARMGRAPVQPTRRQPSALAPPCPACADRRPQPTRPPRPPPPPPHRARSRLGVDVCEAGFPIASEGDFEAVATIAKEIGPITDGRVAPMRICGLARATAKDLDRCYDAVRHAPLHRIHTFLASSDIHLEHKLNISRAVCIERAVKAVRHAKAMCEPQPSPPPAAPASAGARELPSAPPRPLPCEGQPPAVLCSSPVHEPRTRHFSPPATQVRGH